MDALAVDELRFHRPAGWKVPDGHNAQVAQLLTGRRVMTFPLSRRCLVAGGAAMIGATAPNRRAKAQVAWPTRPVRLVVGFTAGSATDVTGRLFAQKFSEAWGQPVVVDNVVGNSGAIGVDRVAKAAPDGYTLMWSGNAAITILPSLQALPFDPLKDFEHISTALVMPSIVFVNNDLPVKSLADLFAYARDNPGKLSYG